MTIEMPTCTFPADSDDDRRRALIQTTRTRVGEPEAGQGISPKLARQAVVAMGHMQVPVSSSSR